MAPTYENCDSELKSGNDTIYSITQVNLGGQEVDSIYGRYAKVNNSNWLPMQQELYSIKERDYQHKELIMWLHIYIYVCKIF